MRPCGTFDERYSQDMAILRIKRHWGLLIGNTHSSLFFPLFGSYYFISLINQSQHYHHHRPRSSTRQRLLWPDLFWAGRLHGYRRLYFSYPDCESWASPSF